MASEIQNINAPLCQRKILIDRLTNLIQTLEDECKRIPVQHKIEVESKGYLCNNPTEQPSPSKPLQKAIKEHRVQILSGEDGQPCAEIAPVKKSIKWTPKIEKCINLDSSMPCYNETMLIESKNNMNRCSAMYCECNGEMAGAHSHKPEITNQTKNVFNEKNRPEAGKIIRDYCTADRKPYCPKDHSQLNQLPKYSCNYPNYCKASCFDHPITHDWKVNRKD